MTAVELGGLLEGRRVCICAGPGGVGKTTTSAAVALGMAARGAKVGVLTIDPARRLADALGLDPAAGTERLVDRDRLAAAGIEIEGELWAMTLDAKRTFDELIERHAPDERTRDAVLANRIYQELSSAVAGSQEYMAMEKLHELHGQGRYDLLVLDTPPSRNALDFLDAPERLSRFVDSRTLSLFTSAGGGAMKLLGRGSGLVFSLLEKATGIDLLRDLSDFFNSFGDMSTGFRERADAVTGLLADRRSGFLIVTSASADAGVEAQFLHERLHDRGLPFVASIANRIQAPIAEPPRPLDDVLGEDLAAKVGRTVAEHRALAEHDAATVARLRERLDGGPLLTVPELDGDVHDLDGLVTITRQLFGGSRAPGGRPRRDS